MRPVNTTAHMSPNSLQTLFSTTTLRMSTAPPPKTQARKRPNKLTKKQPSASTNSTAGPLANVLIWVLSAALVGLTLVLVRRVFNGIISSLTDYVVGRFPVRCRINYWLQLGRKTYMMRYRFEQGYTQIRIKETK
jgi:hypothetical protein